MGDREVVFPGRKRLPQSGGQDRLADKFGSHPRTLVITVTRNTRNTRRLAMPVPISFRASYDRRQTTTSPYAATG